ncbi:MAG: UDP-N-acetylmuramate dehydrogenase, partial [Lachnospiraceae bacterium]|nr:UDP-N-acetylmuramate dehydrogenase [Lachnospiraceae bacterium]
MRKSCSEIESLLSADRIRRDVPMSDYTTFRIGGPASFMLFPETEEETVSVVNTLRNGGFPYYILGRGSNLLVSDEGFPGYVVNLRNFRSIVIEGNVLTASSGALLSEAAREAYLSGLSGLEFASGIPGTVGGGIVMNAGAYGEEMKDTVISVRLLTPEGKIKTYTNAEMDFGYRHSVLSDYCGVVLSASFLLNPEEKAKIEEKMNDLNTRRRFRQPLDKPSAGSTFKRPEGQFAGKLIEEAGLKGYRIGGAAVSEKHAGFIV